MVGLCSGLRTHIEPIFVNSKRPNVVVVPINDVTLENNFFVDTAYHCIDSHITFHIYKLQTFVFHRFVQLGQVFLDVSQVVESLLNV